MLHIVAGRVQRGITPSQTATVSDAGSRQYSSVSIVVATTVDAIVMGNPTRVKSVNL